MLMFQFIILFFVTLSTLNPQPAITYTIPELFIAGNKFISSKEAPRVTLFPQKKRLASLFGPMPQSCSVPQSWKPVMESEV
jgi:hypothetical protein